jgi:hypothetical protein
VTVGFPQKDAVSGLVMLDYGRPQADALEITAPQFGGGHLQKRRNQFNLPPSNPDIPLPRPGAAPATPLALEVQPGDIPRIFFLFSHRDHIPK